jgi:hypothetical protein
MDTKLSMKVNIYVEWNKKLQQITYLRNLKYHKHMIWYDMIYLLTAIG